jgi:hypothetical protein
MTLSEIIKKIIDTGNSVLTIPVVSEDDSELFMVGLDKYLAMLDEIQLRLSGEASTVPKELSDELFKVHQKVSARAEKEKQGVLVKMTQLHQRASILKTYTDQWPSRISITGKRTG